MLEIRCNGRWVQVTESIFRAWCGGRRKNGKRFRGRVYTLGS